MLKTILGLIVAGVIATALGVAGIIGILKAIPDEKVENIAGAPLILILPVYVEGSPREAPRKALLDEAVNQLRLHLSVNYEIGEKITIPEFFLDDERIQVNAQSALNALGARFRKSNAFRILFITGEDIFLPGYNFIFGLAQPGGKIAIVSDARMSGETPANHRKEPNPTHVRRLAKVMLHELGHTFLLRHSEDERSVMRFHNNLKELDETGDRFLPADKENISLRFQYLADFLK